MKFQSLKCPECGATLDVKFDLEFCFCMYCGSKIYINDENRKTYRYINDADVKRAETERIVRLKELELEEKDRVNKKILVILWLSVTAILGTLGIIGWTTDIEGLMMCLLLAMVVGPWGAIGLFATNKKKVRRVAGPEDVIITDKMADYESKNYSTVAMLFRSAGFINVTPIPLNDLNMLMGVKNGRVESVSIGGEDDFDEGDIFPRTSYVAIMYHSMK